MNHSFYRIGAVMLAAAIIVAAGVAGAETTVSATGGQAATNNGAASAANSSPGSQRNAVYGSYFAAPSVSSRDYGFGQRSYRDSEEHKIYTQRGADMNDDSGQH